MRKQGKFPRIISLPMAAVVAAALVVGACEDDDDPTGPSAETSTQAMVVDEPGGTSSYSGDMAGDFQFSVSTDGQTWTDVGSPNGITVLLQDASEVSVHGSQEAPAGTFPRVRLLIRGAEATVAAGSEIGGTTLTSDATVSVGGSEDVLIEREITPPSLEDGEELVVTFDLNSEAWLTLDAVTAGQASNAAVESAVTVTTEVAAQ